VHRLIAKIGSGICLGTPILIGRTVLVLRIEIRE